VAAEKSIFIPLYGGVGKKYKYSNAGNNSWVIKEAIIIDLSKL
jgi:hypothetical protein